MSLDNDIIVFRDNMTKVAQFANGNELADVQTTNGPIPTLAKIAKTSRDLIDKLGQNAGGSGVRVDSLVQYTDAEKTNALTNIGLQNVNNTADLDKPVSEATKQALAALSGKVDAKEDTANKGRPNGYPGLSGLRLVLRNVADTFNGYIANNSTADRVWTFPDKSGTIALLSDITQSGGTGSSETKDTILAKLEIDSISGTNTGDETAVTILNKLGVAQVEATSNKATNFTTVNDTLYPSVQAVKFYVDNLTVGVLRDCGNYNASGGTWPAAGGTGLAGAIQKGNFWYVNAPGTLGGVAVNVGDSFRALADNPGQDNTKWAVLESNIGYVPYNATNPAGYISSITGAMVTTALGYTPINPALLGASNGIATLNGFAHNLTNDAGTFTSKLSNVNTAVRSYLLPDKDGTIALISDIVAGGGGGSGPIVLEGAVTGGGTGTITTDIADHAVGLSKLTQIVASTFLGRATAGIGDVEALSVAQMKTLLSLDQVNNTSDANKPVSALQQTSLNAKENLTNKATSFATVNDTLYPSVQATKTYVDSSVTSGVNTAKAYADSLVVGLIDDRGSYNASSNTFPTIGGSGPGGSVLKGDLWYVNTPGTLGGTAVVVGDSFRALVDNPGQTAANWSILEGNLGFVPYNSTNPAGYISGISGAMVTTALGYTPINSAAKDASNGVVGKTSQKINLVNNAGTFTSTLENVNTAARVYVMPDKAGTVAMTSDITGTNSGTNTGDETTTTIKSKLSITTLSGSNTGDETNATILSKIGYTPLNKAGDSLLGALNYNAVASIASAANIDLGIATSNVVEITGTTNITSINLTDGQVRIVRFAASLKLTNGAKLALPGGADIQTQAGDWAVFVWKGSAVAGACYCLVYQPVSGLPVFGGNREKVRNITANTSSTTIDLNNGDNATVFKVTVSANTTITFTNPPPSPNGEIFNFTLITVNDSTAGRSMGFGNTIQWAGGLLPPRTTAANAKDLWSFYIDGGAYGGSLSIADQK